MNMDGTEGARSQSNRAFARNFLRLRDVPIAFWDERMSTMAVNRMVISKARLISDRSSGIAALRTSIHTTAA